MPAAGHVFLFANDTNGFYWNNLQTGGDGGQALELKRQSPDWIRPLGEREDMAWARRNDAAHGTPVPEGEEVAAIIDMHLLRGLFNRMLLRITDAADVYVDYATGGHPYRRLAEPPEGSPPGV